MAITVVQESKNKILFSGFRIVKLQDDCTRECIRYFSGGNVRAIIQKNGNVAINGSGLFDNPHNLRAQRRIAFALYGLKMVGREFWQAAISREEASERSADTYNLKNEAERLGFKIVPLPKPKKVK